MLALSSVLPLAEMRLHCAAPSSAGATAGAIIGLTSDNTYNVRLPYDAPRNVERWTAVSPSAHWSSRHLSCWRLLSSSAGPSGEQPPRP